MTPARVRVQSLAIWSGPVDPEPLGGGITQMLNDRGGIECDLTVTRTGAAEFCLVTRTGFATHDLDWIARGIPAGAEVQLTDVTSAFGVLALMGPRSREILARVTGDDVGSAAFPFGAAAPHRRRAATGRPFRGRAAIEAQARDGVGKLPAGFSLADPEVLPRGRETILRDGEPVGWLSSAGFGYSIGRGLGYVRRAAGVTREFVLNGRCELEVASDRHAAEVHLAPIYDPAEARVKA